MTLPKDLKSTSYRFYKTLNEDVKLTSNEYGEWDIVWDDLSNDWLNCDGFDSLRNACVIAILTRFKELIIGETSESPPYENFGCRIHELIKKNKGRQVEYQMELFVLETLHDMRRVKTVHWVNITDNPDNNYYNYRVDFCITPIEDELTESTTEVIEGGLYI